MRGERLNPRDGLLNLPLQLIYQPEKAPTSSEAQLYNSSIAAKNLTADVAMMWPLAFLTATPENVQEVKITWPEAKVTWRQKRLLSVHLITHPVCLPPRQGRWSWRRWTLWTHLPRQSWAVEKNIPSELCLVFICLYYEKPLCLSAALLSKPHKKLFFLLSLSSFTQIVSLLS